MTGDAGWQAVLSGADAERAERIVVAIATALSADDPPPVTGDAAALTDGLPGWALFFASLHRAYPDRGHGETAGRLLDAAVDESAAIAGSQQLFGGITGLAWVIQHLGSIAKPEYTAALDAIDAAMLAGLEGPSGPAEFDLMSGLVGLGVFALERAPSHVARGSLERLVVWLDASAERTAHGISWRSMPPAPQALAGAEFPAGCHYAGVAHGTAGVVGLLAGLVRQGIAPDTTRRLLDGAVEWVLAEELPGNLALFPYQIDAGMRRPPSRTAWCTGGPGISVMLWRAGLAAGERAWQTRGMALARAAARRPLAEMGVKDACLCHGAAGLGQLYARWFNATDEEFFRDEAARWFRRAMDYRRPGEGVAGYLATNGARSREEDAPGLLFGAAGVGLALLSATTTIEPAWDRLFLMSDPCERFLAPHIPRIPPKS